MPKACAAMPSPTNATPKACGMAALWIAALLSLAPPGLAQEASGADSVAMQDPAGFRKIATHDGWTLYFKKNSLDIWHGNTPYERLKNGHADFVVTWKTPVHLPGGADEAPARSAAVSYIFSCSPPVASVLASVVFYASSFVPREDSLLQQWTASRQVVRSYKTEEAPASVSWNEVFTAGSRHYWTEAWQKIYAQICNQ